MSYRPYRRPGINPIWVIIGVNFVIFLASLIDQRGVIDARFGLVPAFLGQQPWTVFTYMFLHASWVHIIFNMLTFYFFGTFAMALIGETAFLTTYFAGGIMGGLFFFLFSHIPLSYFQVSQYSIVVGASGAIYALGGLLIMLRPNTRVYTFPIPIPMPLWIAILVGFVFITFFPGVAWQAHLGGLAYGLAVGYYYRRREIRRY
jgi:membrane associated rhomboid family serine protease